MGDKCKKHATQSTQRGRQMGNKWKNMPPRAPRVGEKCGRQVGDKCEAQGTQRGRQAWETNGRQNLKACGPEHDKCGRQAGDKCKFMRPRVYKWETIVNMRPRAPRVGEVWKTSGRQVYNQVAQSNQSGRQAWETSGRQI